MMVCHWLGRQDIICILMTDTHKHTYRHICKCLAPLVSVCVCAFVRVTASCRSIVVPDRRRKLYIVDGYCGYCGYYMAGDCNDELLTGNIDVGRNMPIELALFGV